MQGNVEEIISYMNVRFRTYEVFEPQLRNITRELMERGYTLEEIIKGINAYLVQLEPLSTDSRSLEKSPGRDLTFRVLDREEAALIGRDAQGYLWLMREMGLLSPGETEEIIAYIVENELEVESGEELQMVMMDLILDRAAGSDYLDEEVGLLEAFDEYEDLSLKKLGRKRLN